MRVIYSSKFHCYLCNKEQPFNVLGQKEVKGPAFEQDALRFARHDMTTGLASTELRLNRR